MLGVTPNGNLSLTLGFIKDCYQGKQSDSATVQIIDITQKGEYWLYD
jgi:hypothetical protein